MNYSTTCKVGVKGHARSQNVSKHLLSKSNLTQRVNNEHRSHKGKGPCGQIASEYITSFRRRLQGVGCPPQLLVLVAELK